MPILTNDLTPAQVAAQQVKTIARQMYTQLGTSGKIGYDLIWNNPTALPADIIAALENEAEEVFALASLNIQTITSASTIGGVTPPTMPSVPSQYELTFNMDGTGNLVDVPPVSSSSSSSSESGSESSESSLSSGSSVSKSSGK